MSSPSSATGARDGEARAPFEGRDIRAHHIGAKPIVRVLAIAPHLDEANLGEKPKVMRHGGL
jgi:hypothetical protein